MKILTHILAGTDFSPPATRAVGRATQLAAEHGATVEIVHVMPFIAAETLSRLGLRSKAIKQAERDARERLAADVQAARSSGVRVKGRVEYGRAASALASVAARSSTSLVVLGCRGERSLRDALIGTTAERFVERDSPDTLVVKTAPRSGYRRVLACAALDPMSERVITTAATISDAAQVTVLHAYEPLLELKLRSAGVQPDMIREHRRVARREAKDQLDELLDRVDLPRERLKSALRRGYPPRVILDTLSRQRFDLVVIGRRRSVVAELLLGRVAKHVLRGAPCDVLVMGR